MIKVAVRCWKEKIIKNKDVHYVYVSYPESLSGYDIISCKTCGHLYAVDVAKEAYIGPPLSQKLESIRCSKCNEVLFDNYYNYPQNYLKDGEWYNYRPSITLPDDNDSEIIMLESIY